MKARARVWLGSFDSAENTAGVLAVLAARPRSMCPKLYVSANVSNRFFPNDFALIAINVSHLLIYPDTRELLHRLSLNRKHGKLLVARGTANA